MSGDQPFYPAPIPEPAPERRPVDRVIRVFNYEGDFGPVYLVRLDHHNGTVLGQYFETNYERPNWREHTAWFRPDSGQPRLQPVEADPITGGPRHPSLTPAGLSAEQWEQVKWEIAGQLAQVESAGC